MSKSRLPNREIDIPVAKKTETCAVCDTKDLCGVGRAPCYQTGEFVTGPFKGKLLCEVQGPPVWSFSNASTKVSR